MIGPSLKNRLRNFFMTPSLHELCLGLYRNPVLVVSAENLVLYKNPAFEALFFLHNDNRIDDLFEDHSILADSIQKVISTKGSLLIWDVAMRPDEGGIKNFDADIFPIFTDDGLPFGVCIFFYDRTRNAHVLELQKRNDRIRYLATIAQGLAHEIRNPLSGIKGASQLLSQELKAKPELREYADIIQNEVVRVDKLLKDLMHFTKPRELIKKKINVNQVAHDVLMLQKTVEPDKVQFVEDFDPSLPSIKADAEALLQVFLNLVKNARQSISKKGTVKIKTRMLNDFTLKKGTKRQQLIAVDVQDTGLGIDEKELTNIFVPFFTTKPKGTGLGLPMCYQIVEEHGGNIQVKSEKGKGSTFSVFLPV